MISAALYDHPTRVIASVAKDTTEKRAEVSPRAYWFTSCLAKTFSPTIEPWGLGFFIEPLSSSTITKSIGVAQGGLGDGGGDGGGGLGGGDGGGLGGGGEGGSEGGGGEGGGEGEGGGGDGDGGGGDGDGGEGEGEGRTGQYPQLNSQFSKK